MARERCMVRVGGGVDLWKLRLGRGWIKKCKFESRMYFPFSVELLSEWILAA